MKKLLLTYVKYLLNYCPFNYITNIEEKYVSFFQEALMLVKT